VRVVLAGGARIAARADELRDAGAEVVSIVAAAAPADAIVDAAADPEAAELLALLARADLLAVEATRNAVTADLVAACDRFGVRIVPLCEREIQRRSLAAFGLTGVDADAPASLWLAVPPSPAPAERGRVIVVWGPAGAPGRSTVAAATAVELARLGRRVALVDADSHAPSLALAVGLADEGPGFAAACRQAERGALTVAELSRIAAPLGDVEVLTGINRPGRWPELGQERVVAALGVCREWVDDVVVDVAAPLERDEEIISDLGGPRRNAATLGALAAADVVIAVVAADPIGVSRFVRAHADLRSAAGDASVRVLVNKTRVGALGIDACGQVRRTLDRFAGIGQVWFAPWDPKSVDSALLSAQPIGRIAGRSALASGIRRFVVEAVQPPAAGAERRAVAGARRRSRTLARAAS